MTHTILVVDDEASLVEVLANILEFHHYGVLRAYDGIEALQVIKENQIDLLITDYMMPRLDGIALQKRVSNEAPAIPIIMMSALPDALEKLQLHAVLKKPFSLDAFIEQVESALKRNDGTHPHVEI